MAMASSALSTSRSMPYCRNICEALRGLEVFAAGGVELQDAFLDAVILDAGPAHQLVQTLAGVEARFTISRICCV